MGRDIISDDHRHVVKEKHKPSLIQILKLWFFIVAIVDFLKGLTKITVKKSALNFSVGILVCQPPDSRCSFQPAS